MKKIVISGLLVSSLVLPVFTALVYPAMAVADNPVVAGTSAVPAPVPAIVPPAVNVGQITSAAEAQVKQLQEAEKKEIDAIKAKYKALIDKVRGDAKSQVSGLKEQSKKVRDDKQKTASDKINKVMLDVARERAKINRTEPKGGPRLVPPTLKKPTPGGVTSPTSATPTPTPAQ